MKEVITATALEIHCRDCGELVRIRKRVLSGNIFAIARVGKDTEIQFLSSMNGPGSVYLYFSVPKDTHTAFEKAKSKGEFFSREIKGVFDYKKLS